MLLVAINPGTCQEMAPLLALCLWKNKNYNIGVRKILEIDKSKLLFGGRLWFWFSPPETERGPVWFYPEEAQAQPCLLNLELQCYLPWRIRFHAGMIHPSWSQRACCWHAWLQLCFWWHTQGVNLPQPSRVSHPEEHGVYWMCPDGRLAERSLRGVPWEQIGAEQRTETSFGLASCPQLFCCREASLCL